MLPRMLEFRFQLLPTPWTWTFSADMRKCVESWIILGAVLFGTFALSNLPELETSDLEACRWIVLGKIIVRLLLQTPILIPCNRASFSCRRNSFL
jgi:hypothetical protein